jgi:hypothetical protein
MAMLSHAVTSNPPLGKHCAFPQTDPMDDLLAHGSNDEASSRPLPWR